MSRIWQTLDLRPHKSVSCWAPQLLRLALLPPIPFFQNKQLVWGHPAVSITKPLLKDNSLQGKAQSPLLRRVFPEGIFGWQVMDMRYNSPNENFTRLVPFVWDMFRMVSSALGSIFFAHHVRKQQRQYHRLQYDGCKPFPLCRHLPPLQRLF